MKHKQNLTKVDTVEKRKPVNIKHLSKEQVTESQAKLWDALQQDALAEIANNVDRSRECLILIAGGAHNPAHVMHIEMMRIAKQYCDENEMYAIAGFFIPSSDRYVRGKGKLPLKMEHRHKLLELSCQEDPWIFSVNWGWANAGSAGNQLRTMFQARYELSVTVKMVWGADMISRGIHFSRKDILIARPPYTKTIDKLEKSSEKQLEFHYVKSEKTYGKDISSTKIRNLLEEKNFEYLLELQLCVPEAVEYMKTNYDDLFLT